MSRNEAARLASLFVAARHIPMPSLLLPRRPSCALHPSPRAISSFLDDSCAPAVIDDGTQIY